MGHYFMVMSGGLNWGKTFEGVLEGIFGTSEGYMEGNNGRGIRGSPNYTCIIRSWKARG